jgi:ABC-type spermidine/putrescine transport system permease subunit II
MTKPSQLERIFLNIAVVLVILFFMMPIFWLITTALNLAGRPLPSPHNGFSLSLP